ncbi:MAG: T9SS type A sorting domain-containing protein [Crocinitomicaceae bacterium]
MRRILLSILSLTTLITYAQNFEIGHTTITFNDPNRTGGFGSGGGSGRQIQTEIYYPADIAGTDVAVANGSYPIIVFGHGFVMGWDAYENIWTELVPRGFILAFPRTEGGFSPSHSDYGLDLAQVETKMQDENSSSASLFYNHVTPYSAIMGHSMGGGSTFLAGANNTSIQTVIGLAPAETNPSAIAAATNVSVPALIFSADEDAVTPPADHHIPIYNGLSSSCKYFINIQGGGHCYYANSNFNCDFGETASSGNISITRQEQQDILFRYLIPWLNLYLKKDCAQNLVFTNDLANDADVTHQVTCSTTFPSIDINVSVSGATLTADQSGANYQWIDCNNSNVAIQGATSQSFQANQNGSYGVVLEVGMCMDTSICYSITTLGLEEQIGGKPEIRVYPNPSNGEMKLDVKKNGKLQIISSAGQLVFETELQPGSRDLKLDLESGIYYMHYQTTTNHLVEQIFISRKR